MGFKKEIAFALVFLCVISLVTIQSVKSQSTGNIYINTDGSVSGTNKITHNDNEYTLTEDIYDSTLIIERNNIVVDGGGFTLLGAGGWGVAGVAGKESSAAINLTCSNVTIENFNIKGWEVGIYLPFNNNTVKENVISETRSCIAIYADNSNIDGNYLASSIDGILDKGNNDISTGNWIVNNYEAFLIYQTTGHVIFANRIENNTEAINTSDGEGLEIYYNNFINNQMNVVTANDALSLPTFGSGGSLPSWDNGKEGNYWSNYTGVDANHDGVGDTPYVVRTAPYTTDRYPLITPYDVPEPSINSTTPPSTSTSQMPISNNNPVLQPTTNSTMGKQPTNNPNQQKIVLIIVTAALAAYLAVVIAVVTFSNNKIKQFHKENSKETCSVC